MTSRRPSRAIARLCAWTPRAWAKNTQSYHAADDDVFLFGLMPMALSRLVANLLIHGSAPKVPHNSASFASDTWEFRKIGSTLFWGPYNKDPTM